MGDRSLPQELKRWATEEMGILAQDLPPDNFFKMLCSGQGAAIWRYVTHHVYNNRNVKIIRGNLRWYQMQQDEEVRRLQGQSQAVRQEQLQDEVKALQAELAQLDAQISGAEEQLAAKEQLVGRSWAADEESRRRELLLTAFQRRCREERRELEAETLKVHKHCQQLEHLARMSEVELVFGSHTSGPEPQVLREVRSVCEERLRFFQSLLEAELGRHSSTHVSREERDALYHHWLSTVEALLQSHPPGHCLSAIKHLASLQQASLQHMMDTGQQVNPIWDHDQHKQFEKEDKFPSVQSLLQCAWEDVEHTLTQLNQTRSRVQQLHAHLETQRKEAEPQLTDRCAFEMQLQCVMEAARRDSLREQCELVGRQTRDKREELQAVQKQRQEVVDVRQLLYNKQEQIRALIKANSSAKSEVIRIHAETGQFVGDTLSVLCCEVMEAAAKLRNSVSQDVKQSAVVSLSALNRRVLDGDQRIPADWLSVNRLQNPTFYSLCHILTFPMYKAPEQLFALAVAHKLELRFLQRRLQLHSTSRANLQSQRDKLTAKDLQALLQMVCEVDQELLHTLLPRIQTLIQQSSKALRLADEAKTTVTHWWEQPAQYALPEQTSGGLTMQMWLQRWRRAAKALE